jgi:MFS family permease
VVGPLISDELALSPVEFGWVASAFFGSFALLQIPVGIAFDRWGVRRPMALMMLVGAARPLDGFIRFLVRVRWSGCGRNWMRADLHGRSVLSRTTTFT